MLLEERLKVAQAGMDAYHANQGIDDCPYPMANSDGRRTVWMCGWLDARSWALLGHIFKKYGMKH